MHEAKKLLAEGRKDKSGDYTKGANLNSDQIKIIEKALDSKTSDSEDVLEIIKIFESYKFKNYKFDPSVIRGLEYYTGHIFEVNLNFEVKNLNTIIQSTINENTNIATVLQQRTAHYTAAPHSKQGIKLRPVSADTHKRKENGRGRGVEHKQRFQQHYLNGDDKRL